MEITTSQLAGELRAQGFTGRLEEPGAAGYDVARAGWNGAIDRFPAAVAFARDAEDVAAAIRGARAAGLRFTVRGGGHSVAGRSVRDGALCIDLRGLNGVEVDPQTAIVRVGGGALLRELDAATQAHGLAVPAGQISHTGVGGLTLGGGFGWLMRHHGLTIDSLRAAEVVLAGGQVVHASEHWNRELFWALRGGAGEFGVVTRFEFQTHRVGTLLGGMLVYPWERARAAFETARAVMAGAPDALTTFVALVTAPDGRRVLVVAVAWSGGLREGERVLAPLRAGCELDGVGPMSYVDLQSMLDHTAPHGWRFYDKLHYLSEVGDEFIDTLLAGFETAPTPQCHVMTAWLGGAIDCSPPGETAFGHRGARALTWLIGCSGSDELAPAAAWVQRVFEATARYASGGVYVNALEDGRPARDAYDDAIWERLLAAKRRYDPDGVFDAHGIHA